MARFLRKHALDLALSAIAIVCVPIALKSSSDPVPAWLRDTWLERVLLQFSAGNQLLFDLALGVLISLLLYVLVVRIPEFRKRKRHRAHLLRKYSDLKEECIMNFLFACNGTASLDLVKELKDREKFKAYFSEKLAPDQERWHEVLNGMNSRLMRSICDAIAAFRREVEYSLSAVDVDEDRSLAMLRQLTGALHAAEKWTDDYDDVKAMSKFMWSQHTGWDIISGYTDRDAVEDLIGAM